MANEAEIIERFLLGVAPNSSSEQIVCACGEMVDRSSVRKHIETKHMNISYKNNQDSIRRAGDATSSGDSVYDAKYRGGKVCVDAKNELPSGTSSSNDTMGQIVKRAESEVHETNREPSASQRQYTNADGSEPSSSTSVPPLKRRITIETSDTAVVKKPKINPQPPLQDVSSVRLENVQGSPEAGILAEPNFEEYGEIREKSESPEIVLPIENVDEATEELEKLVDYEPLNHTMDICQRSTIAVLANRIVQEIAVFDLQLVAELLRAKLESIYENVTFSVTAGMNIVGVDFCISGPEMCLFGLNNIVFSVARLM